MTYTRWFSGALASFGLLTGTSAQGATLINSIAALETCLEGGAAGATVSCAMDEGTYSLGSGLSLNLTAARALLVCPFGPSGTVFTMTGSGVAIQKSTGSGALEIENCTIRDVGVDAGTVAVENAAALRRVTIEGFAQTSDVGFRGPRGTIVDSSIRARRPIDASTGAGGHFTIESSSFAGLGSPRDRCFYGYDSAAGNPQVFLSHNKWSECKGFQFRTEGTWHMIDDEGYKLGVGGQDPNDAIFVGSANDFKVRLRARGAFVGEAWNSVPNLLIYWSSAAGGANANDATSFDFELYDADSCPAIGWNIGGMNDTRPLIEWDGDDAGGEVAPTFHRFRLAIQSDTINHDAPARFSCDRPNPFGPNLLAGWQASLDGHRTQGLYQDSLWRIEIKDGAPQKTLPNTGQMTPPRSCDWNLESPGVDQDGHHQCRIPTGARLSRVSCSTSAGTATINLYERTPAAPNSGSVEMLGTDLVCDTSGEELDCDPVGVDLYDCSAVFADDAVDPGNLLTLGVQATSGAGHLRVHAEWY